MDVIVRCTLRDHRKGHGYTQRQLQAISGVNRGTISKYERNEVLMPVDKAYIFAKIFDCRIIDLYEFTVAGED